ncbi:MAG: nickel pincer cofactor biosynthesis protein LarB [Clostridia bacterium]|nr:nickel pincer cofactor biosynthesis protein LarB [Clostridia bacterium]MDR3643939.1 nickel pincer cofactor biosynthesis protein LarB [Clostridia bacterium]
MGILEIMELLEGVKAGDITVADAAEHLKSLPYEDIGFANIDHHRALRQGFAEVIFCQGKQPGQIAQIAQRLAAAGENVLATRADEAAYGAVKALLPGAVYHRDARIIELVCAQVPKKGCVAVVSAGTADIPVAEEAAVTAEACGCNVSRVYDVGVAGIHRLFAKLDKIKGAQCVIVVAGMEGALASVIGGLIERPCIAVPTSIGYGASFGGLSALLAMLNSCAAGVAVVNIDNGFGAAVMAAKIVRLAAGGE